MKKRTKLIIVVIVFFLIIGMSNSDTSKNNDVKENTTPTVEPEITAEITEPEKDANGWTVHDYEMFNVALKTIAKQYLVNYKLPFYDKWLFMKYDDERILATTDELTFKDSHDKHSIVCVFKISEDGDTVYWSYFATEEKVYFNDGTCKVLEYLK